MRTQRKPGDQRWLRWDLRVQQARDCLVWKSGREMKSHRTMLVLGLLVWLTVPLAGWAKRSPAPVIEPIVHAGVRYSAPNEKGTKGYVVATEVNSGRQLWQKTVFRKWICPCIEHDVQWVFIREMRLEAGRLVLVDERNRAYALDLKKRSVKRLKAREKSEPKRPARSSAGDWQHGLQSQPPG